MSDWKLDWKSAYVPDVIPDSNPAMYRKAGFGHPIGSGRKVGIAVVDMRPPFIEDRAREGCGMIAWGQLGLDRMLSRSLDRGHLRLT